MFEFIKQQLFPGFYANYSNKIISQKYKEQQEYKVNIEVDEKEYENLNKQLKSDLEKQIARKERIDDKSKSILFIIAVAITAITFSLDYISKLINTELQTIPILILFLSIVSLVSGAIRALQALSITKFHVHQLQVKKANSEYIVLPLLEEKELLKDLVKSKQLNDLTNIQLSNYTYASFILIRNGIILFVMFFISTIGVSYYVHSKVSNKETNYEVDFKLNINNIKRR